MLASVWVGEWCQICDRRNNVGFSVPDSVWEAVIGEEIVVCPTCFDEVAEIKGVPYNFVGIWPVTWSDWIDG